jgi:guanylate kinase
MKQVAPWPRWPSGDCKTVAVVKLTPHEIELRSGLRFEQDADDLDAYRVAAVADRELGQLWLWRYQHAPEGTTQVMVDADVSRETALTAVERQLGPLAGNIAWVVDDDAAGTVRSKPVVVVLHGPAGVGKDSVIDLLRERTGIHRATSSTTRAPRNGERPGLDYYFLSHAEFELGIAGGEFIEWAQVYHDLKGVHRSEIEGPLSEGRDLIIRTDVQGARTWRKKLEGAVFIFLIAEDRETLRARLMNRGSETPETLARRIAEIDDELDDLPNNDYVVVNRHDGLDDAVAEIQEIIERERVNLSRPVPRMIADSAPLA